MTEYPKDLTDYVSRGWYMASIDVGYREWLHYLQDNIPEDIFGNLNLSPDMLSNPTGFVARAMDEAWCAYGDDDTIGRINRWLKEIHGMVDLVSKLPFAKDKPLSWWHYYLAWEYQYARATDSRLTILLRKRGGESIW